MMSAIFASVVEGDERAMVGAVRQAPGDLAIIQSFVNTRDLSEGLDELTRREGLRRWLMDHHLLYEELQPTDADVRDAVEWREALRALLASNGGRPVPPDAIDVLNRFSARACLSVMFTHDSQAHLARGKALSIGQPSANGRSGPLDLAVSSMLAILYTGMVSGTWTRLKVCSNDACEWAFYDASRNRSARWCSMTFCGSRFKSRTYRYRLRGRAAGTSRVDDVGIRAAPESPW